MALTGAQILYDDIAMRTDPLPSQPKSDDTDSRNVSVHESTNIKSPDSGEDHSIVFYIGEESLALTNILMTSSSHEVRCPRLSPEVLTLLILNLAFRSTLTTPQLTSFDSNRGAPTNF